MKSPEAFSPNARSLLPFIGRCRPIRPRHAALPLEEVERRHIEAVLHHEGGNVTHAARTLDIDRVTLYNKIKKYGLRRTDENGTGEG